MGHVFLLFLFFYFPYFPNLSCFDIWKWMGLAGGGGYQSMRSQKLLSTETKKNIGIFKNISSSNNNSLFRSNATINTNRFSYNVNDKMIKEALPKIGRTNLFNIKKSSSQIFLKKENLNKAISSINLTKNKSKNKNKRTSSINKHEFIIAKKKRNLNVVSQ